MRTLYFLFKLYSSLMLIFSSLANADTSIYLGSGYREDSLNWSIAGPGGSPDVLSELKWKDLRMWQISGGLIAAFDCPFSFLSSPFLISLDGDYARIVHGKNRDSDYLGDHRTIEFSRSLNSANSGEAFDLSASAGYCLNFICDSLEFCPQIGYSHHEQHLRMRHGFQAIDLFNNDVGPFPGLHSNYRAKWFGPWIGFDAAYHVNCAVSIFGAFQYHAVRFNGRGHWNLRTDFADDFHQHGWGQGLIGKLGGQYEFDNRLAIGLLATCQSFWVRNGGDRFALNADALGLGTGVIISRGRVNEVNWHSFRIEAYLAYTF